MIIRLFMLSLVLLSGIVATVGHADCLLPVGKTTLRAVTVNGQTFYQLPKEYVDKLTCIDPDLLIADRARQKKLENTLLEYRQLTTDLAGNIQGYQRVNGDLNSTLDRSVALTHQYDEQVKKYDDLAQRFDALATRYDNLTEKYRDIAINRTSFIALDAGMGLNEEGDVIGLLGVGYKNLRAWGIATQDSNGLILGGELPF